VVKIDALKLNAKIIPMMRINKYLAMCDVGPRRQIEQILKKGEFRVNNQIAEVGQMIDENNDRITLYGQVLTPKRNFTYIILNKPAGIVTTMNDELGRDNIMTLIKTSDRVYPVGRLDKDSSGLIILTNDGDLALQLTHPKYHLPKVYLVKTLQNFNDRQITALSNGVEIYDTKTLPAKIDVLTKNKFEITLHQGMKRQIREMCRAVGLDVIILHRIAIGAIKIGDLKLGEYRELREKEIAQLRADRGEQKG